MPHPTTLNHRGPWVGGAINRYRFMAQVHPHISIIISAVAFKLKSSLATPSQCSYSIPSPDIEESGTETSKRIQKRRDL